MGEERTRAPAREAALGLGQRARRACVAALALVLLGLFAGCGDDGDSTADELAKQRELAAARKQGAQDARQSERIKQLERELREEADSSTGPVTTTDDTTTAGGGDDDLDDDWPGGSGYTAMLGAFSSEENARDRQREATERGLDAGVVWSSDYASLRPGYWVVFSGTFQSSSEARERADRAKSLGYTDSYPRFISP